IDPIALDSLEINLSSNNKEADKLQNLLNHYHFGKGNPVIMNKIIKSLPEVPLNAQHIMSIRRLILDQQIILDRPFIKRMFKNEKQLESVFQSATLFLDEETNISTDNFVADNYSVRIKTRIYNPVIGQLQRVNKVYYLPKHIFTYLEKTSFIKFNHAIILARFYASTGKKDELKKLLNLYSPEKRYKLLVNLSMYLF